MRKAFIDLRNRFRSFYDARLEVHNTLTQMGVPMIGHDFFSHDHPVAQTCLLIHDDERATTKAWLAAMLHSLDRLMTSRIEEECIERLLSLLPPEEMREGDKEEIRTALRNHDEANGENDSLTQKILQDADRLANVQSIIIIRAGQFTSKLPAIELGFLGLTRHPHSTYRNPRSAHDSFFYVLEWDPEGPEACPEYCLRLEKAIEFGRPHFEYIRDWFRHVQADFAVLGLEPWPIE